MTLKPKETEELKNVQILNSKHARYIEGCRIIDKNAVALNFILPGTVIGKLNNSGKYAPVTRDFIDIEGAAAAGNKLPLVKLGPDSWHNWQLNDEIVINRGKTSEETAIITAVNEEKGFLKVDNLENDHSELETVEKNEGSSKAMFITTNYLDLSSEDGISGGIEHGTVYKNKLINFDSIVENELLQIEF